MINKASAAFVAIVALQALPANAQGGSGGGGSAVRLGCHSSGALDFSVEARYEERGVARRQFKAEFEAGVAQGFTAGQVLPVSVGGLVVGQVTLKADTTGDLVGELKFDNKKNAFPANFPSVGAGTGVSIGNLGCDLK
jgi:hypothetical protein